jgi:hypothetical protein
MAQYNQFVPEAQEGVMEVVRAIASEHPVE